MFQWLRKIWPSQKTPRQYYIVEVEKGMPTTGDVEAISSLKNHPGMIALVNRMRLKRAALKAQLENSKHESLRDVDLLVTGLYWLRYIESEVSNAVGEVQKKTPRLAVDEVTAFEEIRNAIESIGTTSPK